MAAPTGLYRAYFSAIDARDLRDIVRQSTFQHYFPQCDTVRITFQYVFVELVRTNSCLLIFRPTYYSTTTVLLVLIPLFFASSSSVKCFRFERNITIGIFPDRYFIDSRCDSTSCLKRT